MNGLMKLTLTLVVPLLLSSCVQQAVRNPDSPFYRVPVGSRIVLNQPLDIRSGHTRVFLQRGAVTGHSDLDQYWPSCSFEVRDLKQTPQQIAPDTFAVKQVQLGNTQIVGQPSVRVAGLGLFSLSEREIGEPLISRYYDLWLQSDSQPNVMRLRCFGAMADLSEAWLPRYPEIETALGTIATIERE
ncbi:hypothetical protein [Sedimenticola hydrogenitrophicus]|uniref:hypothetical protein n=1 Tax=Sedimenticola hydrogenitrophicus TaxID=2967975 RepID=UPI0021A35DED|nr:hypothetical protein [Sedimenticola hydrogenitrophicus]